MSTQDYDDEGNGQVPLVPTDDGVADAAADAAERIFGGRPILKFADRQFTLGKDRDEIAAGTRMIFRSTAHYWRLWLPDENDPDKLKPGKIVRQKPGQRFIERGELEPAYNDENQWPLYKVEPQDPWRNTRAILFEDPDTGDQCVFTTTSKSGKNSVVDLCGEIQRQREVHAGAYPIVELRWANFETDWGTKSKPSFKIVQWLLTGDVPMVERKISAKEAKKVVDQHEREMMDDEVPF
jgi:hypothetical protein